MKFGNPFGNRKRKNQTGTPVSADTPANAPVQDSTPADLLNAFEDYINSLDLLDFNGIYTNNTFTIKCIRIDDRRTYIGQGNDDKNGLFYGILFSDCGRLNFYQSQHPTEYATLKRLYNVCANNLEKAEPIRQRKEQEAKKREEQNELNKSVLSILKTAAKLSGNEQLIAGPEKDYTREDLIDACAELVKNADSLRFREYGVDPNGFLGAEILATYREFIIIHEWDKNNATNDTYKIEVSKPNQTSGYRFSKTNENTIVFQKLNSLLNTCVQNIEPSRKREQEKAAQKAAEEYQNTLNQRTAWFKKRTLDKQKS